MLGVRIFSLLLALLPAGAFAQTLHSLEGTEVPQELLGVYRLYQEPRARHLRSPLGYRPVYLTHYGRHGSRYVKYDSQYGHVRSVLAAADSAGVLTPSGDSLWMEYSAIYPLLEGRTMYLTPLGLEQHRGIAARMVGNFPSLFRPGAHIDAVASTTSRTVQSMDAFCEAMLSAEPGLDIVRESSRERMYCLNPYSSVSGTASEWDLVWNSPDAPSTPAKNLVAAKLLDHTSFTARIFKDSLWVSANVDACKFCSDLYYIAIDIPNTPVAGVDLCKYFKLSELEALNNIDTFQAYCDKGRYSKDGSTGRQWALSQYILGDMVDKAVSDLESGECVARLRFGHDGCLMAMYAMLGIAPWGCCIEDDIEAARNWDSSLTPMACNLQVIVYRNRRGRMLLRVLYNEEDFKLPLKTVRRRFYRPADLLEFCRSKIDEARTVLGV